MKVRQGAMQTFLLQGVMLSLDTNEDTTLSPIVLL